MNRAIQGIDDLYKTYLALDFDVNCLYCHPLLFSLPLVDLSHSEHWQHIPFFSCGRQQYARMASKHDGSGSSIEKKSSTHDTGNSSIDAEGQVGHVEGLQSGLKSRHAQMIALGKCE